MEKELLHPSCILSQNTKNFTRAPNMDPHGSNFRLQFLVKVNIEIEHMNQQRNQIP